MNNMHSSSYHPVGGERNSSIELYRIIATLAVLIVHFNGWFVGGVPEQFDISNPTLFRTAQMIISAASVICVNMFIIISGYFGIRLRLQSIIKLCLQLLLIYVPFYLIRSLVTHDFNLHSLLEQFFVISNAGYFIQCYFMLMILSPLLNAFVDKYGKKCFIWVIVFFVIETWFSCIMNAEPLGYNSGYSVIHFVLMYMIARCIHLFESELLKVKRIVWIFGYIICTLFICALYIKGIKWCWDYSNPIVVLSSVCTFIPFLYKTYYNSIINWIAKGTLAVYIIQVTNPVLHVLRDVDNYLLNTYSYPIYLGLIMVVIVMTFSGSVLYGNFCQFVTRPVLQKLNVKLQGKFDF